ncbi:MAG: methyltransferase domain-containing protein [Lachnospiraceae bacterium]|nr:methyltransferase domain-containing protein [Lachnospiraceae bacterium]
MKKTQFAADERELSLDILMEVSKGKFLNSAIEECFSAHTLDQRQKSFIKALCDGVTERRLTLDYLIGRQLKTPLGKVKPAVRQILRMGAYQLKFMDSVPDYAAINECVKLTARRVSPSLKGFVNGVLRSVLKDETDPDAIEDPGIRWSCPGWLIDELKVYPGQEYVERILKASLEKQVLYARVTRSFASLRMTEEMAHDNETIQESVNTNSAVEFVIEKTSDEGVVCEKSPLAKDAFVIKETPCPLNELKAFRDGLFVIQDISSQLCATVGVGALLDEAYLTGLNGTDRKEPCNINEEVKISGNDASDQAGLRVLDLCAAPGGKALHAAGLLGERGRVLARDLSMAKVNKINETLLRLGYDNVDLQVGDATVYEPSFEERFDLVMADLPCSGLGVISRKPEIKYRLKPEDIDSLAALQRSILDNAVRYVKKGGLLLYSTCTLTAKENVGQYEYLKTQKGLESVDMDAYLPEAFRGRTGDKGFLQLIQGVDDTDGFFISLYRNR